VRSRYESRKNPSSTTATTAYVPIAATHPSAPPTSKPGEDERSEGEHRRDGSGSTSDEPGVGDPEDPRERGRRPVPQPRCGPDQARRRDQPEAPSRHDDPVQILLEQRADPRDRREELAKLVLGPPGEDEPGHRQGEQHEREQRQVGHERPRGGLGSQVVGLEPGPSRPDQADDPALR
jgi:hypothetical protein